MGPWSQTLRWPSSGSPSTPGRLRPSRWSTGGCCATPLPLPAAAPTRRSRTLARPGPAQSSGPRSSTLPSGSTATAASRPSSRSARRSCTTNLIANWGARGYRRQGPTMVLTTPIHRIPDPAPTTSALACRSPTPSPPSGLPPGRRSKLARTPRPQPSSSLPGSVPRRLPHRDPRPRRARRRHVGGRAGLGRGVLHGHPTPGPPSRCRHRRAPARGNLGCRPRGPAAPSSGRGAQSPSRSALQPARLPAVPPLSLSRATGDA
jgi:hypothetical protein